MSLTATTEATKLTTSTLKTTFEGRFHAFSATGVSRVLEDLKVESVAVLGLLGDDPRLELVEDSDILGNLTEDNIEGVVLQVVDIAGVLKGIEVGQLLQSIELIEEAEGEIILEELQLGEELTLGGDVSSLDSVVRAVGVSDGPLDLIADSLTNLERLGEVEIGELDDIKKVSNGDLEAVLLVEGVNVDVRLDGEVSLDGTIVGHDVGVSSSEGVRR